MQINRRSFFMGAAGTALLPCGVALAEREDPFFDRVVKAKAATLALKPARPDDNLLPQQLKDLDYDDFRMINFRPGRAFWRDSGLFQVQLFHRGFQYDRKVTINLVENRTTSQITYSPDLFDFRTNAFKRDFAPTLGFSGFRLHFPLNRPDYFDEVAVFQGGSYFRLLARGQRFGASARGLAINTADPHGEEFPAFTEFWLDRPAPQTATMTVYGLLESKSTTGAYRFRITPGATTYAQVEAALYPRGDIKKLGVAPLTSMYFHGKTGPRRFADLRPEVHDSDGLLIHNGRNERLWRPLINPRTLQISAFSDVHPKGFGVIQRARRFKDYQDLEATYERRPSLWVDPEGKWSEGAVELVEIPTDSEANDNVSAYWVPKQPIKAGHPVTFVYRIAALGEGPRLSPLGRCIATWVGPVHPIDAAKNDRRSPRRFWVDYRIDDFRSPEDARAPVVQVTASAGKVSDMQCEDARRPIWRAVFTYTPDSGKDADIRAFLTSAGRPITEIWTYRWTAA